LRHAKSAGNRNIELAHWLFHILQQERTDLSLTVDHYKVDRARLLSDLAGVISGFPHDTGTFNFTATVTSGAQIQAKPFSMSVTAPNLAGADVVMQLLGPSAPLNADQTRYLDFLGNNNNGFDVGDFLAWLQKTGATLSPAMIQALQRKGGPR